MDFVRSNFLQNPYFKDYEIYPKLSDPTLRNTACKNKYFTNFLQNPYFNMNHSNARIHSSQMTWEKRLHLQKKPAILHTISSKHCAKKH